MALPPLVPPNVPGFFAANKQYYSNRIDTLKQFEDASNLPESQRNIMTHQYDALRAIEAHFQHHPNTMTSVVLPTGTGKSLIALLSLFLCANKKALIVTPSKVISEQLYAAAVGVGNSPSVLVARNLIDSTADFTPLRPSASIQENKEIQATHSANIVIVNAQKFARVGALVDVDADGRRSLNIAAIPRDMFDMVIVDEAHHYPATSWAVIVNHFAGHAHTLFLTATPPPSELFPLPIFQFKHTDAIKRGVIRSTVWHDSDLPMHELAKVLKGNNRQAMVLSTGTVGCDNASSSCNSMGITALPYYGSKLEGHKLDFVNGGTRVLAVCGKLLEGFDHPNVSVCAFTYATSSFTRFVQFVGRAIRINRGDPNGPAEAVIIGPPKLRAFYERLATEATIDLPLEDPVEEKE